MKKTGEQLRDRIRDHFDDLADSYDGYKQHAAYYYQQVKRLLEELLGEASERRILEIGCGTGELLAHLHPRSGCGVDISENMIEIARKRWEGRPELTFLVDEAETLAIASDWDDVIMVDVLEHLYDSGAAIAHLAGILKPGTRLIITWANNLWTPILYILELLKMKMPEGDHHWESRRAVIKKLRENRFEILDQGTRCLVPAKVPGADFINRRFFRFPLLRGMGLIRFIVARRTG